MCKVKKDKKTTQSRSLEKRMTLAKISLRSLLRSDSYKS